MFSRGITAGQTLGLARDQATARQEVDHALREACETLLGPIYLYARYRVGQDAADDLVSQVFLKAVSRLETFDPARADMRTWIFGIARNVARDHVRAGRRWKWLPIERINPRTSVGLDPERAAIDSEQHRRLAEALAALSDRERDVLGLKFAGDLTNRSISSLTGLSESNVAVTVYRALGKLRRRLERPQGGQHA